VPRDVTQEKPLAEDSFEKARREFFGTAKTTPAPSALSAEYLNPGNAPLARKVAALPSEEDGSTHLLALVPMSYQRLEVSPPKRLCH
jgi:hypothetical protein